MGIVYVCCADCDEKRQCTGPFFSRIFRCRREAPREASSFGEGCSGTARKGVRYEVIGAIVLERSLYLLHGL